MYRYKELMNINGSFNKGVHCNFIDAHSFVALSAFLWMQQSFAREGPKYKHNLLSVSAAQEIWTIFLKEDGRFSASFS